MKQVLLFVFCLIQINIYAQKTITNKDFKGRIYERYQVNANGTYHGTYTKYFKNGIVQELETYSNGTMKSKKSYEYIGATRYLVFDATYDAKGKVLTKAVRPYTTDQYLSGNLPSMMQVAGLLKNGRWSYWPGQEYYVEKYNGNDTIYEWEDKTKKKFIGKYLNGERVYSDLAHLIHATYNVRDSIIMARHDEIRYLSYDTVTANSYSDKLKKYYNNSEFKFYNVLITELKGTNDTILRSMIVDALDLEVLVANVNLSDANFTIYERYEHNAEIQSANLPSNYPVLPSYNKVFRHRSHSYRDSEPEIAIKLTDIMDYMN